MRKVFVFITALLLTSASVSAQVTPMSDILKKATSEAVAHDKNIFLLFNASWSSFGKKLLDKLNDADIRNLISANYVLQTVTVMEDPAHKSQETPGARDYLFSHGGRGVSVPYWVILDKNGKYLANSHIKPTGKSLTDESGDNAAFPEEEDEIAYFIQALKATSHLQDGDLNTIKAEFER